MAKKKEPRKGTYAKLKQIFFPKKDAREDPPPDAEKLPPIPTSTILRITSMQAIEDAYNKACKVEQEREKRYVDYETMLADPIAQSAMELMADDATQPSRETGKVVWITGDKEYEKDGEELISRLALDESLIDWALWICAYGDWFVNLVGKEGEGVVSISDAFHPADVSRVDLDGKLVGFSCEELNNQHLLPPWDFLHFRVQRHRRQRSQKNIMDVMRSETKIRYRYTTAYGLSALEAARKIFKQLNLVQRTIIMARLARAPVTNIVQVNTGNLLPEDRADLIDMVEERFKRDINIDLDAGTYEEGNHIPSLVETITLPVMGDSKGELRVEQFGGEVDIHGAVDWEMLLQQYFGALRVPKAYLGFEESLPGSLGESALYRLEIRYARMVGKIQLSIQRGVARMLQIDRAWRGKDTDLSKFKVEMQYVSSAQEEEQKSALSTSLRSIQDLQRLLSDLDIEVDKEEFWTYLDKTFLHLGLAYEDLAKVDVPEEEVKRIIKMAEWADFKADVPCGEDKREAWQGTIGKVPLKEMKIA